MFCHAVLLTPRTPLTVADLRFINAACATIVAEVPGVLTMRFVTNVSDRSRGYTHAFVARFVDHAAHDRYQAAPQHQELKRRVDAWTAASVVLDYPLTEA